MIVSHIEGGDASQINFVCRAFYLNKLGYNVKYETEWYKAQHEHQTETNCIRLLSFDKLFPSYPFILTSEEEITEARKNIKDFKDICENDYTKQCIYINDYPNRGLRVEDNHLSYFLSQHLKRFMKPPLNIYSYQILQAISKDPFSVAFHVRRGDVTSRYYIGNPVTKDYILKIIYFIYSKNKNITIYFFSDDTEWIRQNIRIPCKYIIIENGVENGHLDLYLMTKCKLICGTQGYRSLYAYLLSDTSSLIQYQPNEFSTLDNIIVCPASSVF